MGRKMAVLGGSALVIGIGLYELNGYVETHSLPEIPESVLPPVSHLPPEKPHGIASQTLICDDRESHCNTAGALISYTTGKELDFVKLANLHDYTPQAFVDTEDRRYYSDTGCDTNGIARAAKNDLKNLAVHKIKELFGHHDVLQHPEGGSGIPRQLVGLIFRPPSDEQLRHDVPLIQESMDQNHEGLARQEYECRVARKLIKDWGHKKVLERYLNETYMGRGAYGIGAAAQAYFGVPAEKLDLQQSMVLAGILTLPDALDVAYTSKTNNEHNRKAYTAFVSQLQKDTGNDNPSHTDIYNAVDSLYKAGKISETKNDNLKGYNKMLLEYESLTAKYQHVINASESVGHISAAEADKLRRMPIVLAGYKEINQGERKDTHNADVIGARQAAAFALAQASDILKQVADQAGVTVDSLTRGGITIHTSLNSHDQKAMNSVIRGNPAINGSRGLDSASVDMLMDGSVRAMVGSKRDELSPVNIATGILGGGSGTDAGSTNKLYSMTYGFDHGWTLKDTFTVPSRMTITTKDSKTPAGSSAPWTISTGQGCDHLGQRPPCKLTTEQMYAFSSNMLPMFAIRRFSLPPIVKAMTDLGLPISDPNSPTVTLGVGQFSPYDEAGGYAAVGLRRGETIDKHIVTSIDSSDGEILYEYRAPETPTVVYSRHASQMSIQAMKAVTRYGTAAGRFQLPNGKNAIGGKTGTGNNRKSLWMDTIACDPRYGSRATSWLVRSLGNKHITQLEHSNEVAIMTNQYYNKVLRSGQTCNISQGATMPHQLSRR